MNIETLKAELACYKQETRAKNETVYGLNMLSYEEALLIDLAEIVIALVENQQRALEEHKNE